jgi:hypothetical protein
MRGFAQQRVWERANRLSLSQLACLGRHTVSNLLCACGRQFHDWSADYRVFSKDRWDVQQLFVPVVQGILDLAPDKSVFVTALDDTLLRKTGTRTPGVGYRRDPLSPPFHCNFIRAQRFIQLSGLLPSAPGASPARAIPIRYEHVPPVAKPKRSACAEEWKTYRRQCRVQNLSTRGRHILHQTRGQLDQQHDARDRRLIACVDGSYTNKTVLKGLPQRTTLIGRLRKDAKLFFPPRDQEQPARGAKRKYGRRAPTPEALRQDASLPWQEVRAFGAGKIHTFRVKTIGPVLWKKAGYDRPLRLVVIAPVSYRPRKRSRLLYRQPAYLICTDPNLPLEKTLQFYLWRWDIEVNHRDEKQIIGVGQAQVTSRQSVDRQPAFAVASYSMLLLAAARSFGLEAIGAPLPPPKWRTNQTKRRTTTQELIQQLRSEVWAYALDQLHMNSEHFASAQPQGAKCSEFRLPLSSAVLYAATG